ncbi:lipopolysaccharide-induced tumor necrosis factor-alpha factor homolog isoform X2 [Festucalex cinctus]
MNATPPQLVSMESFSHRGDSFPAPPHYYSPDDKIGHQVRIYHIRSPLRHPSASSSFDFATGGTKSPPEVFASPAVTPVPTFVVSFDGGDLRRSPAVTSCPSCRAQVTTRVRYRAGTYAWTMCVLFVLCGLVLGCCLLPFLVNHFKDAHHCCPRCHRLLHVHRRSCYQ